MQYIQVSPKDWWCFNTPPNTWLIPPSHNDKHLPLMGVLSDHSSWFESVHGTGNIIWFHFIIFWMKTFEKRGHIISWTWIKSIKWPKLLLEGSFDQFVHHLWITFYTHTYIFMCFYQVINICILVCFILFLCAYIISSLWFDVINLLKLFTVT